MVFSGLAGHAAEFSRGQSFHGALMLQPQDEQQSRAASVITMATLHFGSSILLHSFWKQRCLYCLQVIFFLTWVIRIVLNFPNQISLMPYKMTFLSQFYWSFLAWHTSQIVLYFISWMAHSNPVSQGLQLASSSSCYFQRIFSGLNHVCLYLYYCRQHTRIIKWGFLACVKQVVRFYKAI